ncbi:MAG: hypothetical protein BWY85_00093 [Firmicutes bacterium ADurb.Bin506]|nr:MAG: hypothetical protein BWY85_00093 [Firmicutes bacterium ADurb.Bin506]
MATVYIISRITATGAPVATITASTLRQISGASVFPTRFEATNASATSVVGALSNAQKDPGAPSDGTGIGRQYKSAAASLTAENYKSCGLCPDSLINIISDEVREVSQMVLRVKRLVRILNRVLEGAEQMVLEIINGFIDLIPYPPLLDLRELVRTLMCPLLPQAVVVKSYQQAISSAHRLASNTVSFGSLNPAYYPVLVSATAKYSVEAGGRIISGTVDAVKELFRHWGEQWYRMGTEFWRRFVEYLDTQNPYTDFGSGGNPGSGGTTNGAPSGGQGGKFLKVESLNQVQNPVEGMVVYIERAVNLTQFSGYDRGAGTTLPAQSTLDNPMAGSTSRIDLSAEDRAAQGASQMVFNRTRFVYRNGAWVQLSDSSLKKFVKMLFRLLMEYYSIVRNTGYFAVRVSVTKASVALVRATCPSVYNSSGYPFKAYDELTRNFKMQGFTPSGLGSSSTPFVQAGMRLMLKIEAWVAASYIAVV